MGVSTGTKTLDEILNGGLPEGRTVLFTGTPGTGKSTLAMQFLQQGLAEGEQCLYISTEQTPGEIRDSFDPFGFDLGHANLSIITLHMRPGSGGENYNEFGVSRSMGGDSGRRGFVMRTLEGGKFLDDKDIEFNARNIYQYLKHGASAVDEVDRVVVDSVSGLRPVADDDTHYRRVVLDLIQLFNSEIGATSVFTAESGGSAPAQGGVEQLSTDDAVQFNVHGVVRLWRENIRGDFRRFLDVMKMRGVNHDTRRFEITFGDEGLYIVPQRRSGYNSFVETEHLPTRIDGLDELLGGGLTRGRSALLQHDGQANLDSFLYAVAANALDQRMALGIVPRVDTPPRYLESLFDELGASMEKLLKRDQLFVLDTAGSWSADSENVASVEDVDSLETGLSAFKERTKGKGILFSSNTEAIVHALGPEDARKFRYWAQSRFVGPDDVFLGVHNPAVMEDSLSAFYVDAAEQVINTWLTDYGLQYVQLQKSKQGEIGSIRLLEYIEEAPFVRLVD